MDLEPKPKIDPADSRYWLCLGCGHPRHQHMVDRYCAHGWHQGYPDISGCGCQKWKRIGGRRG